MDLDTTTSEVAAEIGDALADLTTRHPELAPALDALTDEQLEAMARFCALLARENETLNLTRITDPRGMAVRHVVDSLVALDAFKADHGGTVLDLGSGGGVPGIPLAIALPKRPVLLVDSRGRKAEATQRIVDAMGLGPRVEAVSARAEELLAKRSVDTVVSRAVGTVAKQFELLRPVRRNVQRVVMLKGPAADEELQAARSSGKPLGFKLARRIEATLPDDDARRVVLVFTAKR